MTCLPDVAVIDFHYYSQPGVGRSDNRPAVRNASQERYHGQRYVPTTTSIVTGMYEVNVEILLL